MNCPKLIISQFVLYLLVMQGDDVKTIRIKFILTDSPLSPLLPFWPGPPVSPYGDKRTHVNKHTQIKLKNREAVLRSMLAVQGNYLVSVLSWRPRRSRNPWQPYRSQFAIMSSWPHRPLLSLGNRWENGTHRANATILIILI